MTATLHGGLGRDGHLTSLALDQLQLGEQVSAGLEDHMANCAACRQRLGEVAQWQETAQVSPLPANVVPLRQKSRTAWLPLAGVLALAALLLLTIGRTPEPAPTQLQTVDAVRSKGSPVDFEVYAYDGAAVRQVYGGDVVHPGERLGFRLRTAKAGHVMIAGVDSQGSAYLCYPYGEAAVSRPQQATPIPIAVDDAVVLDQVPGDERLVALYCAEPFAFVAVADKLRTLVAARSGLEALPIVLGGCLQREVVLHKRPRSPGH